MKKCTAEDCSYCVWNPPRLPAEVFTNLKFVPDPVLKETGSYKSFEDVYGQNTNDQDRPMLREKSEPSQRDKTFKSIIVASNNPCVYVVLGMHFYI